MRDRGGLGFGAKVYNSLIKSQKPWFFFFLTIEFADGTVHNVLQKSIRLRLFLFQSFLKRPIHRF